MDNSNGVLRSNLQPSWDRGRTEEMYEEKS